MTLCGFCCAFQAVPYDPGRKLEVYTPVNDIIWTIRACYLISFTPGRRPHAADGFGLWRAANSETRTRVLATQVHRGNGWTSIFVYFPTVEFHQVYTGGRSLGLHFSCDENRLVR